MSREGTTALLLSLSILMTGCLLLACARPSEEANSTNSEPRAAPATAPSSQTSPLAPLASSATPAKESPTPPPKANEIREAVARVFDKAATLDATRDPGFVLGDFNGDGSEDLAVAVKPNEDSLGELNNELANWILEDPRKVVIPKTSTARSAPPKPVRAEKGEVLLAIIHGVGPQGWRNREARQTFLLKNAAGSKMTSQPMRNLRDSTNKQKLPPLRGDAIGETIGGTSGLLYWTGAKYAWYSTSSE